MVHLIDGTYELFRHFYGLRRFTKGKDRPYGAVVGVLQTVLQMIDHVKGSASGGQGAAYLGVATDHVIESFRNRLWADYKTGAGIEPALRAQFHPLEQALAAMGVVVWPMIELEADDALASAAHLASKDKKVQKVAIWTPDKDLAQCVRGTRVVQIDGRRKTIRDAAGIREKFGVDPPLIPDLLALGAMRLTAQHDEHNTDPEAAGTELPEKASRIRRWWRPPWCRSARGSLRSLDLTLLIPS